MTPLGMRTKKKHSPERVSRFPSSSKIEMFRQNKNSGHFRENLKKNTGHISLITIKVYAIHLANS